MKASGAAMPAPPAMTARYELRLYHRAEPERTIGTRYLEQGAMTLGRDPASDWAVDDPARTLSRRHCELHVRSDGLAIHVSGSNGAFAHNEKLPHGVEARLAVPCTLALGDFRLAVCIADAAPARARRGADPIELPLASPPQETTTFSVPLSEMAAANRSLLEAFCDGASLDSSQLAGEDPDEIMRRVGAIYRHTLVGVSDLMAERDRARSHYDLQRTRIGGTGNNLFKWASTQRLAVDLLLTAPAGFLSGPDAVRSSLRAIKRHALASQAGMQACLRALVGMFSPGEIERAAPEEASGQATAQIEAVARRHAELAAQLDHAAPPALEEAYILAYEAAEIAFRATDRWSTLHGR